MSMKTTWLGLPLYCVSVLWIYHSKWSYLVLNGHLSLDHTWSFFPGHYTWPPTYYEEYLQELWAWEPLQYCSQAVRESCAYHNWRNETASHNMKLLCKDCPHISVIVSKTLSSYSIHIFLIFFEFWSFYFGSKNCSLLRFFVLGFFICLFLISYKEAEGKETA